MCSTAGSATFLGKSKNGTGRHIRGCVIKRGSRKADKPKSKVEKQKKSEKQRSRKAFWSRETEIKRERKRLSVCPDVRQQRMGNSKICTKNWRENKPYNSKTKGGVAACPGQGNQNGEQKKAYLLVNWSTFLGDPWQAICVGRSPATFAAVRRSKMPSRKVRVDMSSFLRSQGSNGDIIGM